jgi:hypothetical protein
MMLGMAKFLSYSGPCIDLSFVIPSEADLSRLAVQGSAVPRILSGNVLRRRAAAVSF